MTRSSASRHTPQARPRRRSPEQSALAEAAKLSRVSRDLLEMLQTLQAGGSAPVGKPVDGLSGLAEAPSGNAEGWQGKRTSLFIEHTVRSGQQITFPEGDVTVIGSVSSGAEIIAGGSIHVYGALRGRALAGAGGDPHARIFCQSLEAELLAINGLYKTTEHLGSHLHGRAVQAWLDGKAMAIAALNTL